MNFRDSSPQLAAKISFTRRRIVVVGLFLSLLFSFFSGLVGEGKQALADDSALPDRVSFKRDVRPILSDNCFACHGPDANHREADLRLDTREGAMASIRTSDGSQGSLLIRIRSHDDEEKMPPPKSSKNLTPHQIAIIERWIAQGALWEEHWSFTPLIKPEVPKLESTDRSRPIRNPIDSFIQSELKRKGWRAAEEGDRRTLIRRVTLDLTGLPPKVEEVESFLADTSSDAYEKVVKRLLQSQAFGERMAWDWLDAARYADTNGYQGDNERTMWPWRDWVVKAFNENLPFDQFTIWQLAGDMLSNATLEQKLATGFCRNHMINGEGGRIAEENRVDYVMDMTETMGTVWLGMTLNCCRCHDHKFDPIKQQEYYQLFAFFNQTPVEGGGGDPRTAPTLTVASEEQQKELDRLDTEAKSAKLKIEERSKRLASQFASWEKEQRQTISFSPWKLAEVRKGSAHRQKLKIESDQTVLASGENPANDTYELELMPSENELNSIRLDVLQHESMTKKSLSRADSGNFVLTSFELYLESSGPEPRPRRKLSLDHPTATFEQGGHKIGTTLDDDSKTGWAVWEGRVVDRPHSAVFRLSEPVRLESDDRLIVILKHESIHAKHNIGYFRFATSKRNDAAIAEYDPFFERALVKSDEERSKTEREYLVKRHQQIDDEIRLQEQSLKQIEESRKGLQNAIPKVMVMGERAKPRETFLLKRGIYNQPGDGVLANVPASLPPLTKNVPADRLSMARWLVSKDQPLTARVIVNRYWQQFFGVGLVKTVEDFGSQGEIPRYLDLLDWLAADFRESGWDTKHMIELIVTSHAYRQSSRFVDSTSNSNTLASKEDPENRWIARGPRFRMPSWMLRDQALAASGLLVPKLGGPSVNGYQPEGVWEEASFGNKKYKQDTGEALYRRSLYIFWRRIIGPTMFFDNASRQVCTVKVVRTNTPLQALFTLNDVTFIEAARALAVHALQPENASEIDRIDTVFRRVLCRSSRREEQEVLLAGLHRSRKDFSANPKQANAFLEIGESKLGLEMNRIELASWTAVCLAILNLDETLTKE